MSKGSVQTCRRIKTSHIVIPFHGTRFTTMPLGIFRRPDVRPNSSRKSPAPSKLLLLRSLILDERQLIKFPISIIGIDGGQLGPNLTFWTNRPSSLMRLGTNPCYLRESFPLYPQRVFPS